MRKGVMYVRKRSATLNGWRKSIAEQQVKLDHFCRSEGIEVTKVYIEPFRRSPNHRSELEIMMAAVASGGIGAVVVESIDRLARNAVDLVRILSELDSKGIEVITPGHRLLPVDVEVFRHARQVLHRHMRM